MIAEALSGIEFSPNPQVARLLADDYIHSAQSTPNASFQPPILTTDIDFSAALETPSNSRNQPSPLPSPLHSPDPLSFSAQLPNHPFLDISPPAPLTPFADLPTPSRWLPSPTPQKLTPGMFLQTPESLKRNNSSPHDNTSPPPPQIQPTNSSSLNDFHTPEQQIQLHLPKKPNFRARSCITNLNISPIPVQHLDNPPEVRRRLFDEDDDPEAAAPEATAPEATAPEATAPETSNVVAPETSDVALETITKSQEDDTLRPGLKSRLAPPPPIRIPGVANTTPGGIYPASKNLRQNRVFKARASIPDALAPSFDPEKFSELIARRRGAHPHQQSKLSVSNPIVGQQGKRKKSRAKPEVENKRPMTERASLVLAEMRRQMSAAQTRGNGGASASAVAVGTDATNFLPYSSAVEAQAPQGAKKEKVKPMCNCKASQCIKRYCPCFATSNFCGKGCGCRNCENTTEYSSVVGRARRVLLERDPNAFVPRIRNSQRSSGRGRQTIRGCNCRKGCEKNYCICRENGLICGVRCTCSGPNGCQNYDESKLEKVTRVIENLPHSSCPAASLIDQKTLKTRALLGISSNLLRAEAEREKQARKILVQQRRHQDRVNTLDIPSSPGLGPFDVLPTPTTPSIPYNPFFDGNPAARKRAITFGDPLEGYKKVKRGDRNGDVPPELMQAGSVPANHHYETPPPKTPTQPGRLTGNPLASRSRSGAELAESGDDKDWRGNFNGDEAGLNQIGDLNPTSNATEGRRIPQVPRIFRYKFGSETGAHFQVLD